jgi:Transposase DDE domain group 1
MSKYSGFSARASLMVVGVRMRAMGIWKAVEEAVHIEQKVVRYRPIDKVLDALIMILAGGRGIVEVNTLVRSDKLLQAAFGREGCADQSTVSATLNACATDNVDQLRQALTLPMQQHSRAGEHDYAAHYQVLDIDMSGLGAGEQGEGVSRGYFADGQTKRGRQLGRVIATWYGENVYERLYDGKRQLHHALETLVDGAEEVLMLQRAERQRTLLRIDRGGGEDAQINFLLKRGYAILVKAHSWQRSRKLAASVHTWQVDPRDPDRQFGWVSEPHPYHKPTRQLAVRTHKKDGTWSASVLVTTAPHALLAQLGHLPTHRIVTDLDQALATLYAYDKRGGAAETQFKADKQGLFLAKRNKRSFPAQEMLLLLAQLAHNLLLWLRDDLPTDHPPLRSWGILRLVRDVFAIPGQARFDAQGHLLQITLNQAHPLAVPVVQAFAPALAACHVVLTWGQI